MKIDLTLFEKNIKNIELTKINIFYGHSNSGKSTFLSFLKDSFNGKNTNYFLANELQVGKEDFKVINIEHKKDLSEELKFSSKSELKNIMLDEFKKIDNEKILESINKSFLPFKEILSNIQQELNIDNNETLNFFLELENLDFLIPKILKYNFDGNDYYSSSTSRLILYNLLFLKLKTIKKKTIILTDDFDIDFDEEESSSFINKMNEIKNKNVFFILTSNKPTSLLYLLNISNVFTLKNKNIIYLNNILNFDIEKDFHHKSFEEYMLYNFKNIEKDKTEISNTKDSIIFNLGRLLTSKKYNVNKKIESPDSGGINIFASNEEEFNFYNKIIKYIKTTNQ